MKVLLLGTMVASIVGQPPSIHITVLPGRLTDSPQVGKQGLADLN
jgi:hypothetical protein